MNIIEDFSTYYYNTQVWGGNTKWFGTVVMKPPTDIMIYQEIIYDVKPDFIIETGTFHGGGALFMANMMDILGKGQVITIDNTNDFNEYLPSHARIKYLKGSSTSDEIIDSVKKLTKDSKSTMVSLDSDHTKNNVSKEMSIYSKFVTQGNYMILEDTNINNPIQVFDKHDTRLYKEGPNEALTDFLKTNTNFVIDKSREKYLLTFNPNGYLRRVY